LCHKHFHEIAEQLNTTCRTLKAFPSKRKLI
jgi:hypothetical protein